VQQPPPPAFPVPPRSDLPPSPRPLARPAWVLPVVLVTLFALLATALGTIGQVGRGSVHGQHRFLEVLPDGTPYRWNPCQPIHYEVNLIDAPDGAMADVREAVQRVSDGTGIAFVFDGVTTQTVDTQIGTAFQDTTPEESRWLPLLVAWIPHEHFDFLVDTHKAVAFGEPQRGDGDLAHEFVSGVVAIDAGEPLPPGFGERFSRGVVLMHELGHLMGLAHVGSGDEIMWSSDVKGATEYPDPFQTSWGPGDLEGLKLLGRDAGCLTPRG
jgi:hypothetical protein